MAKKPRRRTITSQRAGKRRAPAGARLAAASRDAKGDLRVYQKMVAGNPDRMSFVDANYIYREINDAYLITQACSRDDIVGRHIAEILGQAKFETTVKPHFDACLAGSLVRYQDWFEFPTLGKRFVDVIYNPFFDTDGRVTGVVVTARDFTEAHQADAALQETRARLDLIASTIEEVVWISDWRAPKVLFANPAYEKVWGRALQDLYADAKSWLMAVHATDRPRVQRSFGRLGALGRYDEEYRIVRPDGEVRWIHDRGYTIPGAEGEATLAAGVARDVTERRQLEEALRTERQRLRAFLENSAVIAWMKDEDGRYVFLSNNFQKRLQVRLGEWTGKTDFDVWPQEVAEEFRRNDRVVLDGGRAIEAIERAANPDGSFSWWLSNKFPFVDESGRRYVGGLGVDITERERAERARRQLEEKLSLAQKLEAVGKLAAGMAHDVNSLLMVILGNVELIQSQLAGKGPVDTVQAVDAADRIVDAVARGKVLLEKLLMFGRVRSSRSAPVDLNSVVTATLKLVKQSLGKKIRVERRLETALASCEADASQLQQMVMNLVMNAIDAMPTGGTLTVATESVDLSPEYVTANSDARAGRHVVLTLSDTGVGMDNASQQHVFEPYFSTKPVNKGSGLGLSIVYAIVKQAGGHITLTSEVGKGTTFRISIPCNEAPD